MELFGRQFAILLREARYVGPTVVNPYRLGRIAFGEKDDVSLCAWAIRRERTVGEAQDGVEIAVFGQNLENFARLICEKAIVRHHQRGTTTRFKDRHYVLDEVQLLVARGNGEVVARRSLICALGAERGVVITTSKRRLSGIS